ncbi:T9SS type A sorting domain-containing protein [bacterium]|nr:T9SS type A sorting domain-containing protein [bacterium]
MFPVGQTTASPSISPEGVIYSLSDGVVKAIADHGGTAAFLWGDDFKWIATALLPTIGPKSPIAKANSIVSVTSNYLYVTANLGYEVFLPVYQKYFFIPKMTVMLVLNPDDGSPVAPPVTLRDTCDGVITIGYDENIYITHGSTARSITYYSINKFLPPDLKVEKPIGGVSALEPVSFLELAEAGIHWVQNLDAAALFNLDAGNLDEAYTQVHHGTVQLGATANSISDAEELGEIDSQSAQQARQRINTAQTLLNNAKNHIAQARIDPNEGLLNSAKQLIENAEKKLEEALEILAGSAAPPIAKTISKEFRFSEGIPVKSELVQNYPNPFNPETWLPYNLAKDADVIVKIYNVSGQLIRTLDLAHKDAGFYLSKDKAAHWDGRDNLGERVASGIYFYTLKAGDFRATRRMLIMK